MPQMIEVSTIVYTREDGAVLVGKRSRDTEAAWYWEFPGGKIEEGESPAEAALRESQEELGFAPDPDDLQFLGDIVHQYDDKTIKLYFFTAPWTADRFPSGPAHEQLRWLAPDPKTIRHACDPLLSATDQFLDSVEWAQFTRALGYAVHDHLGHEVRDVSDEEVREEMTALQGFIRQSPTAYQASEVLANELEGQGFEEVPWSFEDAMEDKDLHRFTGILEDSDTFFVRPGGSALIAFMVGPEGPRAGYRIWGGHLDSPALQIKGEPMVYQEDVALLSASVYGGPLLNSFFDRPLSLAGSVLIKDDERAGGFRQVLVDLSPLTIVIPNLAIHQNRKANEGVEIKVNKVMLPVLGLAEHEDPLALQRMIAAEIGCDVQDILDFDLYTYPLEAGHLWGKEQEFYLSPRLDNLAMSFAGHRAFLELAETSLLGEGFQGVSILYLTDNEEIGSRTRAGASSTTLVHFLDVLAKVRGLSDSEQLAAIARSFAISADAAHAVHPHHAEIADRTQRPKINGGPAIKYAAGAYATDARSAARCKLLCKEAGIPYQTFSNRADLRGGSTIGPFLSTQIPIDNVDVGIPMWGMHSLFETMGAKDQARTVALAKALFEI